MTRKEINKTISMLKHIINKQMYVKGADADTIEISIGIDLLRHIEAYITGVVTYYASELEKTRLMGYPVNVVYNNPMCLEVHIVEKVPIYRESEVDNGQNS